MTRSRIRPQPAFSPLRTVLEIGTIVLVALLVVVAFSQIVPFQMDEFDPYQPIWCHFYSFSSLNVFGNACSLWGLKIFNTNLVLPMRSFAYNGSINALLYYPLFLLWRSPLSARFLCAFLLGMQAFIISKTFRVRLAISLLSLFSFFPYLFAHLVDTGAIIYQTLSIFVLFALARRWGSTGKTFPLLVAALVVFLCIWSKLTYLWLLPGIAIVFLWELWKSRDLLVRQHRYVRTLRQIVFASIFFLGLLSILFFSTSEVRPETYPYRDLILKSEFSQRFSLSEILNGTWEQKSGMLDKLRSPLLSTHMVLEERTTGTFFDRNYFLLLFLIVPVFGAAFVLSNRRQWKIALEPAVLFLAFIATFFLGSLIKEARNIHHAILPFPFLVLSVFSLAEALCKSPHIRFQRAFRASLLAVFFAFLIVNYSFFLILPSMRKDPIVRDDPFTIGLHQTLVDPYLSGTYLYAIIDGGYASIQSLYGNDDQAVLNVQGIHDLSKTDTLRKVSAESGRRILFIHNSVLVSSDMDIVRGQFALYRCETIPESSVWQILLEEDADPRNPCFRR